MIQIGSLMTALKRRKIYFFFLKLHWIYIVWCWIYFVLTLKVSTKIIEEIYLNKICAYQVIFTPYLMKLFSKDDNLIVH